MMMMMMMVSFLFLLGLGLHHKSNGTIITCVWIVFNDDEEGVVAASTTEVNSISLSFSWKQTATVDGVDLPVHTTVLNSQTDSDEDEFEFKQQFVLSYARGDVIVHDPVAGVGYASVGGASGWLSGLLPGFGIVATMATISAGAIVMRPRRIRE